MDNHPQNKRVVRNYSKPNNKPRNRNKMFRSIKNGLKGIVRKLWKGAWKMRNIFAGLCGIGVWYLARKVQIGHHVFAQLLGMHITVALALGMGAFFLARERMRR